MSVTASGPASPAATLKAILLMVLTVFLFSLMDATAKTLAGRLDTLMVLWARYASQSLIALLILLPRLKAVLKTRYPRLHLVRSSFLFGATLCFFFAITLFGLPQSAAVMAVNPLLITLGAVLFLRESLGPRRLVGIALGLLGALIIIRPGGAVFSPVALLPLLGALFYSGYALSTRFLGREESIWTPFLYATLIGTLVASLILPFVWTTPAPGDWGLMLLMGAFGAGAQLSLIRALSLAEAGVTAPFAYVGPVFAAIWGALWFDERLDGPAILGTAVIIAAGLYVWQREHHAARVAARAG